MDVLRIFDTMLLVVADQVIEVPRTPSRSALCSVIRSWWNSGWKCQRSPFFVEQTVDIPVQGGGVCRGGLQGFLPGLSPTACGDGGLQGFSPRPSSTGRPRGGLRGSPAGQGSAAFGGAHHLGQQGFLPGQGSTALFGVGFLGSGMCDGGVAGDGSPRAGSSSSSADGGSSGIDVTEAEYRRAVLVRVLRCWHVLQGQRVHVCTRLGGAPTRLS